MSAGGLRYKIRQYGWAAFVTTLIFTFLSIYIFYRRGYYDLYIANKVFAGVSALLLGIVLLIGLASRFFTVFDPLLRHRKELGIVVFYLAVVHGIVSFFFLPSKFPMANFIDKTNWPFIFGLTATIILFGIFLISNDSAMKFIGGKKWWWLQNWGARVGFVLVGLHVFVMKWKGWVNWYKVGGEKSLVHPEWPGASIIVAWFMVFVVLIRVAEILSPRFGKLVWYLSAVLLPTIYVVTFWWGTRFVG
uniref:Uncharacterized protein n=1 Tax=candidate division WWE3 bacterium TaxID=2053526 RepID=A0A7C4TLS1_UNCKA